MPSRSASEKQRAADARNTCRQLAFRSEPKVCIAPRQAEKEATARLKAQRDAEEEATKAAEEAVAKRMLWLEKS